MLCYLTVADRGVVECERGEDVEEGGDVGVAVPGVKLVLSVCPQHVFPHHVGDALQLLSDCFRRLANIDFALK